MVRISVGAPTHQTSGRLYGAFFEDINHSADGGLNANMVNNYSFDGVYLDHHTWRLSGADRWRTQADPLRFWWFDGCSAVSCGTEIRGAHGQTIDTSADCPAPPIHAHSRYARITVGDVRDNAGAGDANVQPDDAATDGMTRPAATGGLAMATRAAAIENLGYNGGGTNAGEPAFAITAGHTYDVSLCIRAVSGSARLSVCVIGGDGSPLTGRAWLICEAGRTPGANAGGCAGDCTGGCASDCTAPSVRVVADPSSPHDDGTAGRTPAGGPSDSSVSADVSPAPIEQLSDGWVRVSAQVNGLATDYGKLHIGIETGIGIGTELGDVPDADGSSHPNNFDGPGRPNSLNGLNGSNRPHVAGGLDEPTAPVVFDLDLVQFMDADYWGVGDPKWRYGKLRRDLVEAIAALHPAFVRFPGGCIVEGVTPGNEYRWKDTVGALPARRAQYSMWSFKMPDGSSYCQSYQIGFYEYFCLCEDLGAKPLPTLFAGIACQSPGRDPRHMDTDSEPFRRNVIQDYLDLIEFANGDPNTSPWAAVRRDMGHPEPFGLDMIGVGNENFGADYVDKFDRIATAIHKRYPDILCVMSAGLFPFRPAMARTWHHARAIANGVTGTGTGTSTSTGATFHGPLAAVGSATGDAIVVDEHSYHSPAWFESQAHRFDDYPRCGAGVYFGEYSANGYFAGQPQTEQGANTWRSALGEAAFLTGCERNSDVVRMTSYAPLLAHIPAKGWAQNLIEFNPAHVNPTVNYEVERLFSTHLGPWTYDVAIESNPNAKHLYVSVTGADNDDPYRHIKIVNTAERPVDVTLEIARGLAGLSATASHGPVRIEVETLTAEPDAKTVIGYRGEATKAIDLARRTYTLPSPSSLLAMKIPPYSVTLVTSR